jgi:AbrB family looped-hinge helix DNA binding protein
MGFNITITSKGQMTIPKDLRDQLKVKPGDKCYAWIRNGEMIIVPRNKPARELADILGQPPNEGTYRNQDLDEAVMDAAVERFEHAVDRSDGE